MFDLHFSGKTTLAKSLSTIASTAAFDKNPQSKERGITLDLGFSSFQVDSPSHISDQYDCVQYTLVDCSRICNRIYSYVKYMSGQDFT